MKDTTAISSLVTLLPLFVGMAGCLGTQESALVHMPLPSAGDWFTYSGPAGEVVSFAFAGDAEVKNGWLEPANAFVLDLEKRSGPSAGPAELRYYIDVEQNTVLFSMFNQQSMQRPVRTIDPWLAFDIHGLPWGFGTALFSNRSFLEGNTAVVTLPFQGGLVTVTLRAIRTENLDGVPHLVLEATSDRNIKADAFLAHEGTFWLREGLPVVAKAVVSDPPREYVLQEFRPGRGPQPAPRGSSSSSTTMPAEPWNGKQPPGDDSVPHLNSSWSELIDYATTTAQSRAFLEQHPDARLLLASLAQGQRVQTPAAAPVVDERVVRGEVTFAAPDGSTLKVTVDRSTSTVSETQSPPRYIASHEEGALDRPVDLGTIPEDLVAWDQFLSKWGDWPERPPVIYVVQGRYSGITQMAPDAITMQYHLYYEPPEMASRGTAVYSPHNIGIDASNGFLMSYFDDQEDMLERIGASWEQPPSILFD